MGSGFATKAENIGRVPLILSGETLASAAAAVLPLRLLRSRPRRCSVTLAVAFTTEAFLSFLTVDFDLEALFTGDGFGAAFLGVTTFLTLLDRDFLSTFFGSFLAFAGDFEAVAFFGVAALAIDFATDAFVTEAFATEALATETLATDAFATEAFLIDGLARRDLATDAFREGLTDLTGDLDFAADLLTDAFMTDCLATEALRVDLATFLGLGDLVGLAFTGLFR